jgi:nucleoside-diphosphate-sugar epimerase
MPKTISILGCGWLGLTLAEHFVSEGNLVKVSTRSENRFQRIPSFKFEKYIIDIGRLPIHVEDFFHADVLVINVPSKDINGFNNLLKEIEESEIEKVLLISSISVYEDQNRIVSESDVDESTTNPLLRIESIYRNSNAIKTTIVRLGGLIGYSRNPGNFFKKGKPIDNPDSHVNLIHRDDCIGIISQIIEKEIWGEVFNCCADTHPTKREFYTRMAENLGAPTPEFLNSATMSFKIISNEKVKRFLSYKSIHPDLMQLKF